MKKCKVCKWPNTGMGTKHFHCAPFIEGFAEVSSDGKPLRGRLGLKVYRFKKDMFLNGFNKKEIGKVRVIRC